MKVILWSEYLKTINDKEFMPEVICEINSINKFHDGLISIQGKLARCCSFDIKKDFITIEYSKQPIDEEEIFQSDEITCPYCGYELSDSWECSDEDINICDTCGSEYEYTRVVEVSYTSVIKKRNTKITELN